MDDRKRNMMLERLGLGEQPFARGLDRGNGQGKRSTAVGAGDVEADHAALGIHHGAATFRGIDGAVMAEHVGKAGAAHARKTGKLVAVRSGDGWTGRAAVRVTARVT